MSSSQIKLTVNGKAHEIHSDMDRSLLEVLREDLHLTGTKYGCGEGACSACMVLVDGKPMVSCSTLVSAVSGKSITTIEGLEKEGEGGKLHPVQQAFMEENAFQCGYCTSGMIMGTVAFLQKQANPTEEQIKEGLQQHVCRCCAYPRIINAVKRAAELLRGGV